MFNVSQFVLRSSVVKEAAAKNPGLIHEKTVGPFEIYRLRDNANHYAVPLALAPVLVRTTTWKEDAYRWFMRAGPDDPTPVFARDVADEARGLFAAVVDDVRGELPRKPLGPPPALEERYETPDRITVTGCRPGPPVLIRVPSHQRCRGVVRAERGGGLPESPATLRRQPLRRGDPGLSRSAAPGAPVGNRHPLDLFRGDHLFPAGEVATGGGDLPAPHGDLPRGAERARGALPRRHLPPAPGRPRRGARRLGADAGPLPDHAVGQGRRGQTRGGGGARDRGLRGAACRNRRIRSWSRKAGFSGGIWSGGSRRGNWWSVTGTQTGCSSQRRTPDRTPP